MAEEAVLVMGASGGHPDIDSIELFGDRIFQIYRRSTPGSLGAVSNEFGLNVSAHLETAPPNPGPDCRRTHGTVDLHLLAEGSNHTGPDPPPSGMSYTHSAIRPENDTKAVRGEDSHGESGDRCPHGIGLSQLKGLTERTRTSILEVRTVRPFPSLPDFPERTRARTDEAGLAGMKPPPERPEKNSRSAARCCFTVASEPRCCSR